MTENLKQLDQTAFTNGDVISYKGENYYRACGVHVFDLDNGGKTSCVKRVGHPGNTHEDYEGRTIDFTEDEKINYHFDEISIESAVNQALGAASTCWENMSGTGVFNSNEALNISDQLLKRIRQMGPIYE